MIDLLPKFKLSDTTKILNLALSCLKKTGKLEKAVYEMVTEF